MCGKLESFASPVTRQGTDAIAMQVAALLEMGEKACNECVSGSNGINNPCRACWNFNDSATRKINRCAARTPADEDDLGPV
ncbi:hypothetical protein RLV_0474 (plasmid) [Rhizobium leguminosarum bv. viciae]|nr:hypothetical protein RLV_0474 [Rhizobium leguminosarum bv. viciae]